MTRSEKLLMMPSNMQQYYRGIISLFNLLNREPKLLLPSDLINVSNFYTLCIDQCDYNNFNDSSRSEWSMRHNHITITILKRFHSSSNIENIDEDKYITGYKHGELSIIDIPSIWLQSLIYPLIDYNDFTINDMISMLNHSVYFKNIKFEHTGTSHEFDSNVYEYRFEGYEYH